MLKTKTQAKGRVVIELNGEVVRDIPNLITTVGLNYIADRMEGTGETVMSHMAVGTDNTAAALGDTNLYSENGRVALSSTVVTADEIVYTATFPAGTATGALVEAGVFNAASSGSLLCRTVFSAINKGASDSVTITWTITIS
ncbi:MAG: hypothetical protein MJH10_09920 [Epibacterium sp.]|nr:hypothetical protein [Epibacterium sp.]NQX73853.1 hypothetical protein [Epibacterium sp.]